MCQDADWHTSNIENGLITENGYAPDTEKVAGYAVQHDMRAMANHNHSTGGWEPISKSAIWSNNGLLAPSNENHNALVVAQLIDNKWVSEVIVI